MNREQLVSTLRVIRHFIDDSLGISKETHQITGFEYSQALLEACAYNTYIETVSNKTDSLYKLIKNALTEATTFSFLSVIKKISKKIRLEDKCVILAFDYTDEEFYGDVQGLEIHGAPKKDKCKGKFKFLTCSIVAGDKVPKLPLISIPIQMGHDQTYAVSHCLKLVENYIGGIMLILFDRGFKAKKLRYTLDELDYRYLMLAPHDKHIKKEFDEMIKGEKKLTFYEFKFSEGNSKVKGHTYLAFLKQVFDKRSEKYYDWSFATNVKDIELSNIIKTYKQRWQIEIGFKVQDIALIRCNSRYMKIRYFLFMIEQLLQAQWNTFYKKEVSFKQFIIQLHKTCSEIVTKANKSQI